MTYKVVTAVATEPVTLAEARLHLKAIDGVTDDDDLITALITTAREYAEHYAGLALAEQTLEMALDAFPADDFIDLDAPPVSSVTSIKYTDVDGAEQTMDAADYALDTYGTSRRVTLAYGAEWPETRDEPRAVRIRYVTGYATTPKAAKQAMLLLITHLYENRGDANDGGLPDSARNLLNTVKLWSV